MKPYRKTVLALVAVLAALLGGCAVVPAGQPVYYDYPPRVYAPVPVPVFIPWHHHHHHRRW